MLLPRRILVLFATDLIPAIVGTGTEQHVVRETLRLEMTAKQVSQFLETEARPGYFCVHQRIRETLFSDLPLVDLLVNHAGREVAVDEDWQFLTVAMNPGHSLQIHTGTIVYISKLNSATRFPLGNI